MTESPAGIHHVGVKYLQWDPKQLDVQDWTVCTCCPMVVGVRGFKLNGETVRTVDPNDVLEYKMMNPKLFTKQVQVNSKHKNIKEK